MKGRNFFTFLKGIILIQIFLLAVIAGLSVDFSLRYAEGVKLLNAQPILVPFTNLQINEGQAEILLQENNVLLASYERSPNKILEDEYNANTIPENIIGSHIQALALVDRSNEKVGVDPAEVEDDLTPIVEVEDEPLTPLDSETLARFKKSQVFLYCTHSGESYIPDSGQARMDGKRGLINQVSESMEAALNEKGLPTQFIDTIHDAPYDTSYTKSRATVSRIVKANKNILGLFDIHRDSIPGQGKSATVKVKGKNCARILIVVGTNERKPHPNWQQNRKFAEQIYQQGEKMYPGLIKGVITKAGTYNQEYHPRALLLEFGSDTNSLAEVNNSAQLFADVLVEVLKEAR